MGVGLLFHFCGFYLLSFIDMVYVFYEAFIMLYATLSA